MGNNCNCIVMIWPMSKSYTKYSKPCQHCIWSWCSMIPATLPLSSNNIKRLKMGVWYQSSYTEFVIGLLMDIVSLIINIQNLLSEQYIILNKTKTMVILRVILFQI